ncbi:MULTISPECIES: PAS domain-containing sensor histidine kinase [Ramlibacter]|nr:MULTISPECIES: PAS domain-containing sensor histidine kinase [Ramlibacter]
MAAPPLPTPLPGLAAADDPLSQDSTFARMWRGFMTARVMIALVLALVLGVLHTLAPALGVSRWLVALCAAYLAAALAVRLYLRPRSPGRDFDPQWVSTIGVDLIAFAVLQFLQAAGINFSPLFALPVLTASAMGSALLALGTAAGVTLLLLADAWVLALHGGGEAGPFLQAALTGAGYFALAFLVNQMAARLAREESAARVERQAARMQAQVNALVIEALSEGVLVVDGAGRVNTANPAARQLLGMGQFQGNFSLTGRPSWKPLFALSMQSFTHGTPQSAELALEEPRVGTRRVQARTRLTAQGQPGSHSLCVIFLQDLREMEARLRTEKLAAMGRMSAAVAHEIRNPLAAIAQANALMDEDLKDPALRQLSGLVRKNAQRLAQIVDEILDLSRARPGSGGGAVLALDAAVGAACADWSAQTRNSARVHVEAGAPALWVRFDGDHLRRVLVNLLDNAARYAGQAPDSIRVVTRAAEGGAALQVWSDGAPLEPSVEQHLFEPFFTSESRSSGLGLFICRELCERHGAQIAYQRCLGGAAGLLREGNQFSLKLAVAQAPQAGTAGFDKIAA